MTTPTPPVSPPLPVRARRLWRKYRSQGWPFQATAGLSALVMAIGAITAVHGFDSGTASTLHAQHPGGPPTTGPGHHGGHGGHHGPGGGTGGSGGSTGAGGPGTGAGGGSTGGSTGGSGSGGGSGGGSTGGSGGGGLTATDRGVTATTIKVVFPVANLSGVSGAVQGGIGSSEDPKESIRAFVGDINRNGGINGRKILPEIVDYDPTDEAGMRADCQTWTKQQKVFAVIDASAWHDANQLCITQEGHTPLITSYTSTSSYLRLGAPNLWWTGPDGCHVARNLVHWAIASGKLTRTTKFGIARSTSDGDTKTYNECLAPALARAHLKARDTAVLTYTESSPNASEAEAAVTRFHAEGIKVILPMLPFFQFVSWIQAENNQGWAPPLLLSDYDFMLGIGLALVGENLQNNPSGFASPYEPQLQNQSGPSYYVYGNHDYPPYASPLGASCDKVWHKAYPQHKDDIESTGTAMTYCQNIRLFAKAATMAGKNLTRARFDTAMSHITYFPGGTVPALRFGPGRYAGPYLQRIVALHDNLDNKCPKKKDGGQQGNCWLVKSGWMQERLD